MIEPLRICRFCGLEAWTDEDLEQFVKSKEGRYGRYKLCKLCWNKYNRNYKARTYKPKPRPPYLRKCYECGLEAHIEGDLERFIKSKNGRYGRLNLCKACRTSRERIHKRKGGKWFEPNRIMYKGKPIYFKENPRINICSSCGLKYPEELGQQTHVHHWVKWLDDPLAWTDEYCVRCHPMIEAVVRRIMRVA